MTNSPTFAYDKVYILKRKHMQSMDLIIHYISLFAPYKMPERNFLWVDGEITASKQLRVALLGKACIK